MDWLFTIFGWLEAFVRATLVWMFGDFGTLPWPFLVLLLFAFLLGYFVGYQMGREDRSSETYNQLTEDNRLIEETKRLRDEVSALRRERPGRAVVERRD